jgi:small GTP-binding protein
MITINLKVGLYGDSDVGKSTLITYLQTNKYQQTKDMTIGVDYFTTQYIINDVTIKFQIWDTAGQERYNSIISKYYSVNIPIFMFDVSNIDSFNNLSKWLKQYNYNKRYESIYMYCIGNKTDLDYTMSSSQINDLCLKHNLTFKSNSYVNDNNISKILGDISENIYRLYTNKLLNISNISIDNVISIKGYKKIDDYTKSDDYTKIENYTQLDHYIKQPIRTNCCK